MSLDGYKRDHAGMTATTRKHIKPFLERMKSTYRGAGHKVKSKQIEAGLGITGVQVRAIVSYLRCGDPDSGIEPEPICSDGGGYWYAANSEELVGTVRHMMERSSQLQRVIIGLDVAQSRMANQT